MSSNPGEDRKEIDVGGSISAGPSPFKINFRYRGALLSFSVMPNEFCAHTFKGYTLMVRYIVTDEIDIAKWTAIDKHGKLVDEGEI